MRKLFSIIITILAKFGAAVLEVLSFFYKERKKGFALLLLIIIASVAGISAQIMLNLPDVSEISVYIPSQTTEIYSSDGVLLAKLHREENRTVVPLSKISPILTKAIIAMEDSQFFEHHGFNLQGIIRALIANIQRGKIAQGGSTITQQLARSLFLTKERTLYRKLAELILAIQIERNYTKEEILELYLNQVYWGHNAYGIESAANIYFGKHASELTLPEAALLAGIIRGPELHSPYRNPAGAKFRRSLVLNRLLKLDIITEREAAAAEAAPLKLAGERPKEKRYIYPYFTSYVVSNLIDRYGEEAIYNGGLRVYTTLDTRMQKNAEYVISQFISKEGEVYNFSEMALVSIDPRTGYIKAMVGGASFEVSEFNRVTQAMRQPGSSFKPYVYTAAMELGISPGYIIEDSPITFEVPSDIWNPEGKWEPGNFDERFRGNVTVRQALESSLNVPSVKLLDLIGVQAAINAARKMGIKSKLRRNLGLTLGVSEITLLEHTSAIGTLANSGVRVEPTAILRVEDRDGTIIEKHVIREKRVLDPNIAAVMVDIMKGVLIRGTGVRGKIDRPAAAKTGTSQEFKDAWFIGYVPQLITGVWAGNDDNTPMEGVTEVAVCPRMWKAYMERVLTGVPSQEFPMPQGLVSIEVCLDSGELATINCPQDRVISADYWWNKVPTGKCKKHETPEWLWVLPPQIPEVTPEYIEEEI